MIPCLPNEDQSSWQVAWTFIQALGVQTSQCGSRDATLLKDFHDILPFLNEALVTGPSGTMKVPETLKSKPAFPDCPNGRSPLCVADLRVTLS